MLADMVGQFRVRTCPDRARATGDRVRRRLFEGAIDAGTRDRPHARNARQAITASTGGRERLAHRLDLLWAKGLHPPSSAAGRGGLLRHPAAFRKGLNEPTKHHSADSRGLHFCPVEAGLRG